MPAPWTAVIAVTATVAAMAGSCMPTRSHGEQLAKSTEENGTAAAGRGGAAAKFDPNDPSASGMVLTFDDEFSSPEGQFSSASSGASWKYQTPATRDLTTVHDGVLDVATDGYSELKTVTTDPQGAHGWAQKYGYFEIRMKLPATGVGMAFFLMSQAHSQRGPEPASEIDVIETDEKNPTNILTTLHRDSAHPGDQQNAATGGNPNVHVGGDVTRGFHTYGALWDPHSHEVIWYVDGRRVMSQPKYDTTDGAAMWMDIMTAYASPRPGGHAYVDYVRAWQFRHQSATAVSPQRVSAPFEETAANGSTLPGTAATDTGNCSSGTSESRPGRAPIRSNGVAPKC